jgi:hypothetical protein
MRQPWKGVPLVDLKPAWVAIGSEWGAGVSFNCPTHHNHRLILFFHFGMGGYDGAGPNLYTRYGDSWPTLTLSQAIFEPGCFSGHLIDGQLEWG